MLTLAAECDLPLPVLVVASGESRCAGGTPRVSSRSSAARDHQPGHARACSAVPSRRGRRTGGPARSGTSGRSFSAASASPLAVAAHADVAPHQALERVADVGQVERFARRAARAAGFASGRARKSSSHRRRRARGPFAGMGPVDQPFQQAVRGQPIGAVQAAGGHFAGRPQTRQRGAAFDGRPSRRRSCNGRRAGPGSDRA